MNAPTRRTDLVGVPHNVATDRRAPGAPPAARFDQSFDLVVLLFPGFSHVCLSSMIEPLRLANTIANRQLFRWHLMSVDGAPVEGSGGIVVNVMGSFDEERRRLEIGKPPDAAMVCAGDGVEQHGSNHVLSLLRLYARRGAWLYGIGTGTWLLAKSGLLSGVRCTIHWPKIAALSETFDRLTIADALFVRDGPFVTCAGGFAAFDMVIDILERQFGADLARAVCRHMTTDYRRDGASSQAAPPGLRFAGISDKLVRTIRLMEQNLEEPLSLNDIAERVHLSRRQLERLFHRYLAVTPLRYYLSLRIERARQLIESTNLPILGIAIACGFASSSHFAKVFRDYLGKPPSSLRSWAGRDALSQMLRTAERENDDG